MSVQNFTPYKTDSAPVAMTKADRLGRRQLDFITAMQANTLADAARSVGVSERTGRRWLAMPAVMDALRETQRAALETSTRRAVDAMGKAVNTLSVIMDSAEAPAAARVSAARAVLENGVRLVETLDLAARVAALEGRDVEKSY